MEMWVLGTLLVSFQVAFAVAGEFNEEMEKEFPVRSMGQMQITNPRGDVTLQGWAFDRVKVKVRKTVQAEDLEKAKLFLGQIDSRVEISEKNIEISTRYGAGVSITDRLAGRSHPKARMDFTVFAPSRLKIKVWLVEGKGSVKGWNSDLEIRGNKGRIQIEDSKADEISLHCPSCEFLLQNIRSSLRCIGESGAFDLKNIRADKVYLESHSGNIKLNQIEGEQLYLSQSGNIEGSILRGKTEFHVKQGNVTLKEVSGFLSGSSTSGNIFAEIRNWNPQEKAIFESTSGKIHLALPSHFSGEADIWSVKGHVSVQFPIISSPDLAQFGPEPAGHLLGRIRNGGELIKVFSETGDIDLIKQSRD